MEAGWLTHWSVGALISFMLVALFIYLTSSYWLSGRCPFERLRKSGKRLSVLEGKKMPLPVDDPTRPELFKNLQGNILSGHGRNYGAHILLKFTGDSTKARRWLKEVASEYVVSFAEHLTRSNSYRTVSSDGGLFGHIAISAAGYKALGFNPGDLPEGLNPLERDNAEGFLNVFRQGMKARARYLLDPPVDEWESPYQQDTHALLILARDNRELLRQEVEHFAGSLTEAPAEILTIEWGESLLKQLDPNDPSTKVHVEHFGYVDGRSQPLFLEEQVVREKQAGGISNWDPSAPLDLVLVKDPLSDNPLSFGSFLVYRKLEQNVRGFDNATRELASELGVSPALAGAMAVGRFKDGTPVVLQGEDGRTDVANNFDYSEDPRGLRCPFQSHIRKTNPRGEAVGFDTGDQSIEAEKRHRIARRGMPYGGPLRTSSNPEDLPESGLGLLFFCYQSDIWEQFEFIQRRWSNNPYFLEPQKSEGSTYDTTGLDPVIGQPHPTSSGAAKPAKNWPADWNKETVRVKTAFASFVKMLGGEYFFSPSLSFFESLDQ